MSASVWNRIRERVKQEGEVAIALRVNYDVIYDANAGNFPITKRIEGTILDFPVRIELSHLRHRFPGGNFPVNNRLRGWIGDMPIQADMPYRVVYSSLAGTIPVNTGISIPVDGKQYFLRFDKTFMNAGTPGAKSLGKKKPGVYVVKDPKYLGGKLVEPKGDDSSGGIAQEAGRPIPAQLSGTIEDILVDLRFGYSYFFSASSGRSPVITQAQGFLQYSPS